MESVLIAVTRFSKIYREDDRAVKTTTLSSTIKPHDCRVELSVLKQLQKERDSHVIQLYDSYVKLDTMFLVFPYYEQNLYQYMLTQFKKKRKNMYLLSDEDGRENGDEKFKLINKMDINHAIDFIKQLSQALRFVHSHRIIHRDLKPQNVMVDTSHKTGIPQLVLTDFGISYDTKHPQEPPDDKITDVSTSIYKAPELLFSVKNYSAKIDIWSLLVLGSQFFQRGSQNDNGLIPAFLDDGTDELDEGSDIRLIMSIFQQLGIPKAEEWPEVRDYGSPAFEGMFGSNGDGGYIATKDEAEQYEKIMELFPRLAEIEGPMKNKLVTCFSRMIPFESTKRISSDQLVQLLS